jgi:hypothetical protein
MDLKEIGMESMNWVHLDQDREASQKGFYSMDFIGWLTSNVHDI